ncbi:pentapeptide repeat-containing protein [Falsiroseomonas sp. HC035]|uniref:pentapeptide repeat-containing protein n=1 Tax=Falsiroseomonas sp. HC035 TaxID=3390999 RepID=UPI003D322547
MVSKIKVLARSLRSAVDCLISAEGWVKGSVVAVVAGLVGFINDLAQPWKDVLGSVFPWLLSLSVIAFVVWWINHRDWQSSPKSTFWRRLILRSALYGSICTLVIGPLMGLTNSAEDNRGALASTVPGAADLQTYLLERLDRFDRAFAILTDNAERQTEAVEAVQASMDLSLAISIVDRARAARDGSEQGQGEALRSLMARGHSFAGADFSGVSLNGAHLDSINFSGSRLHFLSLKSASLVNANFSKSGLRFADVSGADFSKADISEAFAPFLIASVLDGRPTIFRGANLSGANFFAADLRGADFRGADLSGAAFPFADLRNADLRGANLTGAHFPGALLNGALLESAIFDQTNMAAVILRATSITASQHRGTCHHVVRHRTYLRIELVERWPSSRFSSGYEYDDIAAYSQFPDFPELQKPSLPICTSDPNSAVGFRADSATEQRMTLERAYLEKAGRESAVRMRLREFSIRVGAAHLAGPLFALQ